MSDDWADMAIASTRFWLSCAGSTESRPSGCQKREIPTPQLRDGVRVILHSLRKSTEAVVGELRAGEPSIWLHTNGDSLDVSVGFLHNEDAEIVGRRLREAFLS
jgi:hypothetical protein